MSETEKPALPIFISYAHADNEDPDPAKRWLDRLQTHLGGLSLEGRIDLWSDKRLQTGDPWNGEIQSALLGARVAVLLVSPAFLASSFIRNSELPVLLKKAKDDGLTILPIILRPCMFTETKFEYPDPESGPQEMSLGDIQSANPPDKPLNSLQEHEQDNVLCGIAKRIHGFLSEPASGASVNTRPTPVLHNLPSRNLFFTGREEVLNRLHDALCSDKVAALTQARTQAISGLGGVGKTQTAIEYAYRHAENTYDRIFWVRAGSGAGPLDDFAGIAMALNLPTKNDPNQEEVARAATRWLAANDRWLLIFDNADDPGLVKPFLPERSKGHVLLTSRAHDFQSLQIVAPVDLETMMPDEALDFLLHRTNRQDAAGPERDAAKDITARLGFLPLALEQAAAYIVAMQTTFKDYRTSYDAQKLKLLDKRGPLIGEYPESVTTTWSMNFQQVEDASPASAELLRFSAFLAPDAIPDELTIEGAKHLGPEIGLALADAADDPLALGELLEPLTRYSLIRRDRDVRSYSVHRLVSEVIKSTLDAEAQAAWETRVVLAVGEAFPEVEFRNWPDIERLRPHAIMAISTIIRRELCDEAAAEFLDRIGSYTRARGRYAEAEPLLCAALAIHESTLGSDHPSTATSLNNVAGLLVDRGKYAEAEPLHRRALAIAESALGGDHPSTAASLNNLAALLDDQGKYAEAEALYRRALAIWESALGANHPSTASSLNNLAALLDDQGKYAEAEALYRRALAIWESALGADHPDTATSLNDLAVLLDNQGRYAEAEALYRRALAICESALGGDHPSTAASLNNLALLLKAQGKYAEAEALYRRALAILESALGEDHPDTAASLNNLAGLLKVQGKYAEAEALYRRALAIRESALGRDHPDTAVSLTHIGGLFFAQKRFQEAENYARRALRLTEMALGPRHPDVAWCLENYAKVLRALGRSKEAKTHERRAKWIRDKHVAENPVSE